MVLPLSRQEMYRQRYAASNPGWVPATGAYLRLVRSHLRPGMRLLDLGCGRGGVLEQLRDDGPIAFGADADFRSLAEHRIRHMPRVMAFGEALPFGDRSFGMVISSWAVEHFAQPDAVFAEIARVLEPGGFFIFVTPNLLNPLVQLSRLLRPVQGKLVRMLYARGETDTFPTYYRANTPARIAALAVGANLQVEELKLIHDPTYLAFSDLLFRFGSVVSRLLPRSAAIHMVGACRRLA